MTNPPQGQPSAEKQALIDAYQDAVRATAEQAEARKREAERAAARERSRRRRPFVVSVTLLVLAAGAWLLLLRPAWFLPNTAPVAESPAVEAASARLTLVLARQRIDAWRANEGRLPPSLDAVGLGDAGILWRPAADGSYALTLTGGDSTLTLRSGDDLAQFAGASYEVIQRRGRP